jgi:cellulose biosynthesis protein BcsQ
MAGRLPDAVAVVNDEEPGKADSTVAEAEAVLKRLGFPLCPEHLKHRPHFERAINAGKGVTEAYPKNPASEEIRKLWAALNQMAAGKKAKRVT